MDTDALDPAGRGLERVAARAGGGRRRPAAQDKLRPHARRQERGACRARETTRDKASAAVSAVVSAADSMLRDASRGVVPARRH
eukprot:248777-Rhodomonas_salina.2